MLECSVNAFLEDYSPFLPDDALVQAAISALAGEQLLVINDEGKPDCWQDFEEEPRYSGSKTGAFKPLEKIVNVFSDDLGALDVRQRHFFYHDCPYTNVGSEIAGSDFEMDACFSDNPDHSQNNHVICSEAAVVARFQKFTKNRENNRENLMSAASHIMNDDPCRMWMYGITIENTEMAVWYFSRSHLVKSQTFDFTEDIETFVRVFLSFVYATREEMGYDPTIHRTEGEELQYVYEIPTENGTRYFRTIDSLAHRRVLCITGRKTRVWRAVEVKGFEGDAAREKPNGATEVALKDVWLDDGSTTEKEKLDAIFERLETIKEDAYQWAPPPLQSELKAALKNEGYKDYFMEILCDSFSLGKSKEASCQATPTPGILEFSRKAPVGDETKAVEDRNMLTGSTQMAGCSDTTQNGTKDLSHLKSPLTVKTRSYKVKRQYRLVYKEVGESLDRVESLETAFDALLDTYIALVLMYLAGWMHRDVSAGNIIAVKRSGGKSGGKLSDLEYAKHCKDESGSSDPKTGTAFFMPLEIHMGKAYKVAHATPKPDWLPKVKVDPFGVQRPIVKTMLSRVDVTPLPPQLKYHFQHDLESLWWVALYILIHRILHPPGKVLSAKVFTSTSLPSLARQQLFEHQGATMRELKQFLHPALQHELIMVPMNDIPSILYKSYFMDEPIDPEILGKLYHDVFHDLALVVVTIRTEVENVRFHTTRSVHAKKRTHPKTLPKPGDDDEYKGEEEEGEPASDDAIPKRRKKAGSSTSVRR